MSVDVSVHRSSSVPCGSNLFSLTDRQPVATSNAMVVQSRERSRDQKQINFVRTDLHILADVPMLNYLLEVF